MSDCSRRQADARGQVRRLRLLQSAAALAAGAVMLQTGGCSIDTQAIITNALTATVDTLTQWIEAYARYALS